MKVKYETEDGQLFDSADEATYHELYEKLIKTSDILIHDKNGNFVTCYRNPKIVAWALENAALIRDLSIAEMRKNRVVDSNP